MNKQFWDKIKIKEPETEAMKTGAAAQGANGSDLTIYGECLIPLTIGGREIPESFIIMDVLPDIILGLPFMMNTKARILFKENKLILETNESVNGERAVVSIIEQRKDTKGGKPNNTPNQEEAPPAEGRMNLS